MAIADVSLPLLQKQIRILIIFVMIGLVLSGLTAFPIEWQLAIANDVIEKLEWNNRLSQWFSHTYEGVRETNAKFPFIAYGTDWLAFAHLVIAVAFVGPLRDPIKNKWVIEFGLIACIGIFPLALIAGDVRGIPVYWRIIDCLFGVCAGILLWICYAKIRRVEKLT